MNLGLGPNDGGSDGVLISVGSFELEQAVSLAVQYGHDGFRCGLVPRTNRYQIAEIARDGVDFPRVCELSDRLSISLEPLPLLIIESGVSFLAADSVGLFDFAMAPLTEWLALAAALLDRLALPHAPADAILLGLELAAPTRCVGLEPSELAQLQPQIPMWVHELRYIHSPLVSGQRPCSSGRIKILENSSGSHKKNGL
jgi:hypothetical protein